MRFAYAAAFLSYPVLIHAAVLLHRPWLQCVATVGAYAGLFFPLLIRGRRAAWLGLAAFAIVDYALISLGSGVYALCAPSIIVPGLVLSVFAPTLLPAREPLITRFARAEGLPLSVQQIAYTRIITWVWTLTVALLLLVTVGLLLAGALEAWSVFANFISYAVLGVLFIGEYLYRRYKFPQHAPNTFVAYLRSMAAYRLN